MENFVTISGCSGGDKSKLLAELRQRGFPTIDEPGRWIVAEALRHPSAAQGERGRQANWILASLAQ